MTNNPVDGFMFAALMAALLVVFLISTCAPARALDEVTDVDGKAKTLAIFQTFNRVCTAGDVDVPALQGRKTYKRLELQGPLTDSVIAFSLLFKSEIEKWELVLVQKIREIGPEKFCETINSSRTR
jgi:hypothetical protein